MFTVLVTLSFLTLTVIAQECGLGKAACPDTAPCCSEYGWCGSDGLHCLGGCDPFFSNKPSSCLPNPVCKDQQYKFGDKSRFLLDYSKFDGNPDTYDWTVDGGNIDVQDGNLVMILTETNAGTRLSSTRYVHYGEITATLKTGRWNGVVAAFITMSNVRDEIDWEFPGNHVTEGQTNFFYRGFDNHGATTGGLTDTYENWHDYTIDWSPEALVFKIDGQTVRTLKASDSMKNGVSRFPSTPARIQLSLWPAGSAASAPGTIAWAGGMINWKEPDFLAANNQFRAYVKQITVKCKDKPAANQVSYVYADNSNGDNAIVDLSDKSPIIGGQQPSTTTSATTSSTTSHTESSTTSSTSTSTSETLSSTSSPATTSSTSSTTTSTTSQAANPPTTTGDTPKGGPTTTTTSSTTETSTTKKTSEISETTPSSSSTPSRSTPVTTISSTTVTKSLPPGQGGTKNSATTTRTRTPPGQASFTTTSSTTQASGNAPSGDTGGQSPPVDNKGGSITGGYTSQSSQPTTSIKAPSGGDSGGSGNDSGNTDSNQRPPSSGTPSSTSSSVNGGQPTSGSNDKSNNNNPSAALSVRVGRTLLVVFAGLAISGL